ncbi:MAG: hypothetical protein OEW75_18595, partial [Cyclobacteriaceae bacterium]|nr:hypothetical protein [Cyclobacteriaceae bacterium]
AATCDNLFIQFDQVNAITVNAFSTLTIRGSLTGYDYFGGFPVFNAVDALNTLIGSTVKFTGNAPSIYGELFFGDKYLLLAWDSSVSDFYQIIFQLSSNGLIFTSLKGVNMTISSGTLQNNIGAEINLTGSLLISTGATLEVSEPLSGGSSSANLNRITINGTLSTSSYVNANQIIEGPSGVFNIGYLLGTEGWWHDNVNAPSITRNSGFLYDYNSTSNQSIAALTYSNLSLSSGGSGVSKTLSASGALTVLGSLSIGTANTFASNNLSDITLQGNVTNSGTWTVTQPVVFSGGNTVSGNLITFNDAVSASGAIDFNNAVSFASTFDGNNFGHTFAGNVSFGGSVLDLSSISLDGNIQTLSTSSQLSLTSITATNGTKTLAGTGLYVTGFVNVGSGSIISTGGTASRLVFASRAVNESAYLTGAGGISGPVTWQRHFGTSANRWRNIGVPLSSGATTDELISSGIAMPYGTEIAYYDEPQKGDPDGPAAYTGWVYPAYNSGYRNASLSPGLGYSLYTQTGDLMIELTGNVFNDAEYTYTLRNTPAVPDITLDGWNYVANPYLSTISWSAKSISTVQVWNGSAYVVRGDGASPLIAPGQSFWIKNGGTDGAQITLLSTDKVTSSTSMLRTEQNYTNRLYFTLTNENEETDEGIVWFKEGSSPDFDYQNDAVKLPNAIHSISTLAATSEELILNAYGSLNQYDQTVIPMTLSNAKPGLYTINFSGTET